MKKPVQPDVNITELEFVDPGTAAAQRWHARIAGSGLLRIAVVVVTFLGVLAFIHTKIDARVRHARLIREAEADRASHPVPARLIDLLDHVAIELAREPFVAMSAIDRASLDALVQQEGIYLRAIQDEVRSSRAVHSATQGSRKDAFLGCLLAPPADTAHATIHRAAIKYRWRVDLDAIAPRIHDADVLDMGFRVASRAWIDEVSQTFEPTSLRVLDLERAMRSPQMVRRASELSGTKFLAIVIDELPTGLSVHAGSALSDAIRESRLDTVVRIPHTARAAIVDADGRVLIRVRTALDAADIKVPNVMADAEEIHGCQAAMAVRSAAPMVAPVVVPVVAPVVAPVVE